MPCARSSTRSAVSRSSSSSRAGAAAFGTALWSGFLGSAWPTSAPSVRILFPTRTRLWPARASPPPPRRIRPSHRPNFGPDSLGSGGAARRAHEQAPPASQLGGVGGVGIAPGWRVEGGVQGGIRGGTACTRSPPRNGHGAKGVVLRVLQPISSGTRMAPSRRRRRMSASRSSRT